ncbi:MAG: hypothetical protein WCW34_04320 [Patescibacteria group bacterium]
MANSDSPPLAQQLRWAKAWAGGRKECIMETNRDSVFEDFLSQELTNTPGSLAGEARVLARVTYYGSQYDLLFPRETPVGSGRGERNVFHQIFSDEGMELSENLYEKFCAQNPGRFKRYRIIFEP